jgi:hypothetical protein
MCTNKKIMSRTQQPEKLSPYFQHKYDDALKTMQKMVSMSEYLWAKDWERYAKEIRAYGLQYERDVAYAQRMKRTQPVLKMPLQPGNLTSVTFLRDGYEYENRRQLSRGYKRPTMFQGIGH